MKRYFNNMANKQVIMVEFAPNSVFMTMDICEIFGTSKDIVEISKSEYRRMMYQYRDQNETNFTMTISC